MRRVKPAKSLRSARFLLMRRRVQKYLPRRPARFFALVALGGATLVVGLGMADLFDHGSRLQTAMFATTGAFGLSVQDVEVEGRTMTPADDLLRSIDVARGTPILSVSPERARARLESLPWVKSATVERRLPDAIFVHLTERQPLALWQRNGKLALIDTEGVIVTTEHLDRYSSLLLVVGEEAPPHAQALIDILKTQPELMKRVNSAVRVADRRWNLQMDSGIAVELPEDNVADAWAHLAEIEKSHALLARDIQSVDLRLGDRVVVRAATPAKTEKNEQKGDGKAEPAKQAPAKQPPAKQTAKST